MGVPLGDWIMMDWPAVLPPPAVASALMRGAQATPERRVIAPADSGDIGNSADYRQKPLDSQVRNPFVVPPRPDADRPTGPPPAFDANVLEAEAERRRLELAAAEAHANAASLVARDREARPDSHASPSSAHDTSLPSKTDRAAEHYYSGLPASIEPQLDLIR